MGDYSIKQLPEYIEAIKKNGKFLRICPDSVPAMLGHIPKEGAKEERAVMSGPLFEQQVTADSVGTKCTLFRINEFIYNYEKNTLTLDAIISFPQKCNRIALQADLYDEKTKQVVAALGEKSTYNQTDLSYVCNEQQIEIGTTITDAAVIVHAKWTNSDGTEEEAAIQEEEIGFGLKYDHVYPKKEYPRLIFGDDKVSDIYMGLARRCTEIRDVRGDVRKSKNIIIALWGVIHDVSYLDYECRFKAINGRLPVSVPAKGSLQCESGNMKFIRDEKHPVTVVCSISPTGTGGALVVATGRNVGNDYQTEDGEIEIGGDEYCIEYTMTKAWKQLLPSMVGYTSVEYNYNLSIECTMQVDKKEYGCRYFVSSTNPQGGRCLKNIPKINFIYDCLAEGTQILMEDGTLKAIQDICIGERVKTDEGCAVITDMLRGTQEGCLRIAADNGKELVMTKGHPILTENGWKQAGELTRSDILRTESGRAAIRDIGLVEEATGVFHPDAGGKPIYANGFVTGDFTFQNNCKGKE